MCTGKPDFVYKYCSAPRAIQILRDLAFYFAAASQLNDLYEFRALSLFTEDDESKFRVFAKRLIAENLCETIDEALARAKDFPIDDIDLTYQDFKAQINAKIDSAMNHSGITCFSSESNNQRMWGTYGDNQKGAVIEFTTDPEKFKQSPHLSPVTYTDSKLPICPSALLTDNSLFDTRLMGMFFCVKHIDWADEKEWRLLLLADSQQDDTDRTIRFESSAITRIFLGPRITPEDESSIRSLVDPYRDSISVFKRQIDSLHAKEQLVGIERISDFKQMEYWHDRMNGNSGAACSGGCRS